MEHKGLHHGDIVHLLSENKIVALGRVHTTEPSDLCHGELLGNGFCSISIDKCLDIQAYLPFPTIDASMVNEVVGGFVKWDIQNVKTVKEVEMNGHTYAATSPNDFIFEANGAPNTEDGISLQESWRERKFMLWSKENTEVLGYGVILLALPYEVINFDLLGKEDVGVVVDKSYNESAGTCTTDDLDCINLASMEEALVDGLEGKTISKGMFVSAGFVGPVVGSWTENPGVSLAHWLGQRRVEGEIGCIASQRQIDELLARVAGQRKVEHKLALHWSGQRLGLQQIQHGSLARVSEGQRRHNVEELAQRENLHQGQRLEAWRFRLECRGPAIVGKEITPPPRNDRIGWPSTRPEALKVSHEWQHNFKNVIRTAKLEIAHPSGHARTKCSQERSNGKRAKCCRRSGSGRWNSRPTEGFEERKSDCKIADRIWIVDSDFVAKKAKETDAEGVAGEQTTSSRDYGFRSAHRIAFAVDTSTSGILSSAMQRKKAMFPLGVLMVPQAVQMQRESISPYEVTYVCILQDCVMIGTLEKGKKIHDEISRQGILQHHMVLEVALVSMYGFCDALGQA
ncbi:hypothetical protein L7F22_050535 [Adiantum nelumboides]|nr:hypothetical protein [Adiantum nelumboides]